MGGSGARYIRRIVDDELDQLLPALPAIALEGPKAVGKTATALQRAGSIYRLDDPAKPPRPGIPDVAEVDDHPLPLNSRAAVDNR